MALITYQVQGSCATFPVRPLSWTRGFKLKQYVSTIHMFGRTDRRFPVRRNLRLRLRVRAVESSTSICVGLVACNHGPKVKLLKISAFKGSAQNGEPGNRANGSKVLKNSVNVSYIPKDSGETMMDSAKAHSVPIPFTSEANERIAGSPAIKKLFKGWFSMLRTPPSQVEDEILGEEPPLSEEVQQTQTTIRTKERGEILKAVWSHFLGVDATIKIPFLIFIPLYLAVNMVYGVEVSKELTPLWILGPLVVACYIKMLRVLWGLYVFSFRQSVKLIKNLPTYYLVASSYVAKGKLKEDVRGLVFQPLATVKNLDYKEFSNKKLNELRGWFMDKYLDFVESIWPHYCGAIRFLKRANLI